MKKVICRFVGPYGFLSNFYVSPVVVGGSRYETAEHAYQASKAVREHDRRTIQNAETPNLAKWMGRRIERRPDWEEVKVGVMCGILRAKFTSGSELSQKLIETGDAELVEGNPWKDTEWGIYRGEGKNLLGKLLMQVRDELRPRFEKAASVMSLRLPTARRGHRLRSSLPDESG